MRTLIAIYSNVTQSLLDLIEPDRLILIASTTFREGAVGLCELYELRFPGGVDLRIKDEDPNDPTPWQKIVSRHIHEERSRGNDVTVDVTGGKTPMSLGAYAAAEQASAPTTYLASTWDDEARRAMPIGTVEIPSVRSILGLDWLTAGDKAFALGQFDAASELYGRASDVNAPVAGLLAKLAKARRAWLDGHYAVARAQWPKELGAEPTPWNLLVGRLAGKRAYELDDEAFGSWLRDRHFALRLRHQKGHAAQDVAREAWQLIEVVARATLRGWLAEGGELLHVTGEHGDPRVDGRDKMTLGLLLGLICEGHAADWTLRNVPIAHREQMAVPSRALRGRDKAGLEVRNGLAHGYAQLKDVERWVADALDRGSALDSLIQACTPPALKVQEPSPLEDPERIRRRLGG